MLRMLFSRALVALVSIALILPAQAAGYERYRRVTDASGNDRFYKNIPIKDFFGTPATVTANTGAGGGLVLRTADQVAIGAKGTITATATGIVTATEILGVAKTLSGGPVGIAIYALPFLVEWLQSRGARAAPVGSLLPFEVKDVGGCTVAPCSEYLVSLYGSPGEYAPSPEAAFKSSQATLPAGLCGGNCTWEMNITSCTTTQCKYDYITHERNPNDGTVFSRTTPDVVGVRSRPSSAIPSEAWTPADYASVEKLVADKTVPPGVLNDLVGKGGEVPISYAPNSGFTPIDGPSSLSSPPTVVSSTSGDTTTNTTTRDSTGLTYDLAPDPITGKSVPRITSSTVSTSTTTTTNNITGAVTTTNNTTTTKPDTPATDPATDTALPEQPKLYTKKYPDGMTGVWRDQRNIMANSPLFTLSKSLMPTVGSSGSCPTMPVNLNFASWANFGTKDVAPPCQVWDWGRAICIVSACLLARRLIFGG